VAVQSSRRWWLAGAALAALLAALGVGVWALARRATPLPAKDGAARDLPYPPPPAAQDKGGQKGAPRPVDRRIDSCYVTRSEGVTYQSVTYYQPVPAACAEAPGFPEVAAYLALQGRPLPRLLLRVDREGEMLCDNLGLRTRTVLSSRVYLHPQDGCALAYDVAMTEGGVPQRLRGYRTKVGAAVETYRGGERLDQNEIQLPPGVEIMPPTMDFVHLYFQKNKESRELKCSFFVPEMMGLVYMAAEPRGSEVLAHGGRMRDCARYEIRFGSTRALENVYTRQQVWFDREMGDLLKRVDFAPGPQGSQTQVTERVEAGAARTLQPLVMRPTALAEAGFPYALDQELVYRVRMDDQELGSIRVRFSPQAADADGPAGYTARARVDLGTRGEGQLSRRREEALTRWDSRFLPLSYSATGEEAVEAKADYSLRVSLAEGRMRMNLHRVIRALPGAPAPKPVGKGDVPGQAAGWKEPLAPVALKEEESLSPAQHGPMARDEEFERPLSPGVCLYDYHRVEHLAVVAYRLPRPAAGARTGEGPAALSQQVAFYMVRQNQSGLVPFTVTLEPEVRAGEGEAEAIPEADEPLPRLLVAGSTHALLPCRMLLAPDGRLLEFVSLVGTHEVVYTLEDPIMRQRAERQRRKPPQEGPVLLRPPWY
jgi:hypothetical protein